MPFVPRTVAPQAPQALRDLTPQQSVHMHMQDVRVNALPHTLRSGEELVLTRWHMQRPKLTVSREQCKVIVAADGTADLVSCGKGPTLLRQSGAQEWYAVSRSDTCPLADGDQISLDCNDPEAAVFTCEVGILTMVMLAMAILPWLSLLWLNLPWLYFLFLLPETMMPGEQRCAANVHAANVHAANVHAANVHAANVLRARRRAQLRAKLRIQLRAKLRAVLRATGIRTAGRLRPWCSS